MIAVLPEWKKLIYGRESALAYIPKPDSNGSLVLTVDGLEKPSVLEQVPEDKIELASQILFAKVADRITTQKLEEFRVYLRRESYGSLRKAVEECEADHPDVKGVEQWYDIVLREAMLRIADKE